MDILSILGAESIGILSFIEVVLSIMYMIDNTTLFQINMFKKQIEIVSLPH